MGQDGARSGSGAAVGARGGCEKRGTHGGEDRAEGEAEAEVGFIVAPAAVVVVVMNRLWWEGSVRNPAVCVLQPEMTRAHHDNFGCRVRLME